MPNKDFQNGLALGLATKSQTGRGILDKTVVFLANNSMYQIYSVLEGDKITRPYTPQLVDGQGNNLYFGSWRDGSNNAVSFPRAVTADETLTAITTDGISYLITIPTGENATSVTINYSATGAVDVDWGDGSAVEVSATTHSYAAVAEDTDYTIVITPHNEVTLYPVGVSDSQSAVIQKAVIREATLGTSVISIGSRAFHYCTNFTKITIPNSATSIGGAAFYNCTSLAEITIPSGVTTISDSAFYECTGLTKAIFSDNVTYIGYDTFRDCTALVSLTCSATVPPTLGSYAFTGCPARMAIYVPAESINAYKAASGWSDRADYIQAIPT